MDNLIPYADAVKAIKTAIVRCRYRSLAAVNSDVLSLYFGVGKFVSQNTRDGKWGQDAIGSISKLLQKELPGLRGFSESGIKRMRSFYEEWAPVVIRPTVLGELEKKVPSEIRPSLMGEFRPSLTDELQVDEKMLISTIDATYNDFNWADFLKVSFTHHGG